jgi:phage tail protein X
MSRYKFTSVRQEEVPRRGTLIYPYIPENAEDIYVISTVGDRLDILASNYYGDSSMWWVIASANPLLKRDTLTVPPGLQVRIPYSKQEVIKKITQENNQR